MGGSDLFPRHSACKIFNLLSDTALTPHWQFQLRWSKYHHLRVSVPGYSAYSRKSLASPADGFWASASRSPVRENPPPCVAICFTSEPPDSPWMHDGIYLSLNPCPLWLLKSARERFVMWNGKVINSSFTKEVLKSYLKRGIVHNAISKIHASWSFRIRSVLFLKFHNFSVLAEPHKHILFLFNEICNTWYFI